MVGTQAKQSFETGSKVEHNLLIYGGLGDLVNKKVLPALEPLRREFNIKYALVDTADVGPDTYYCYGTEPIKSYNAAVIAVPNYLHEEVAMKAMNNGLNLLCEKPIAHTLESCQEDSDRLEKASGADVHDVRSFHLQARGALRDGQLGGAARPDRRDKIGDSKDTRT